MRTLPTLLLALGWPCLAQAQTTTGNPTGCNFQPVQAQTQGEQIQVVFASPACKPAKVRVYRRNSTGKEEEIRPLLLVADRNDTTFAICWDTLFTELGIYEYRAVPVDSMGVPGVSSPWAVANNLHGEISPWVHSISAKDVPGERSIRLKWSLVVPERVRGIILYRAEDFEGPYEQLAVLPPAAREYMDRVQRVKEVYFYRVEVVDVVGLSHVSMPVQGLSDTAPLAPAPMDLRAQQTPKGVALYWSSIGPDAAYYKVERNLPGEDRWELAADGVDALPDGSVRWVDSTATDNRVRNYRVRTVGIGGTISEPSAHMPVQAGDGRTPSTPSEVAVRRVENAMAISWRDPWAEDAGLTGYLVERADAGSEDFQPLNKVALEGGSSLYFDSTAMVGKAYRYRIVGVSAAGVHGLPSRPETWEGPDPLGSGPHLLVAHRRADGIELQWPARERQGKGFNLYRASEDGDMKLLATLPITSSSYLDVSAVEGTLQIYTIRMILNGTEETAPSEPVAVRR